MKVSFMGVRTVLHSLSWVIDNLKQGEFVEAKFVGYTWYMTKGTDGAFRYCDEKGNEVEQTLCALSYSNIRAQYTVHKKK
jgi:hypothetical protein